MRWRLALSILGLILFGAGSCDSFRFQPTHSRYFWWSSIRLDSDPLNKHPQTPTPCKPETEDCAYFDPQNMWVDPGWLAKLLVLSGFPAFLAGAAVVGGLGRLGINQITSFMVSMPLLIFGWYYLLGWLIDRRRFRSRLQSQLVSHETKADD